MIKEIKSEKIPIKLWLTDIEEGALSQARNLANLPFAFRHVALMPDAHEGFGMPIGGVLATTNNIIPNAVGVDIGCGMCALKTSLNEINTPALKKIISQLRETIPVGFKHHKRAQKEELMPDLQNNPAKNMPIVEQEYQSARHQLGTLGGGNHFIEIQRGSDGFIWIMIHSGSRNIGFKAANHYNKLAKQLNEKWKSPIPKKWDLAYLPVESDQGQIYLNEMNYCVDFALASRKLMTERVIEAFFENGLQFDYNDIINIAHNYAAIENHFNQKVIVHRKGATKASADTIGIIPGSQGTHSFIVKGKGNKDSYESCSHGAGRVLGRKRAQRTLNLKKEKENLDRQGIIHSIHSQRDLDEAPSAYKNIHTVMQLQNDLVEIMVELAPLAVIKG